MGHQIDELRELRSGNVGSERFNSTTALAAHRLAAERVVGGFAKLPTRAQAMLTQYFGDMDRVLGEISRILKRAGTAVIVVGNSTIRGIFISNSRVLTHLARNKGLTLASARRRPLQENRRYLPPPNHKNAGPTLKSRMNEEVILTFQKTSLLAMAAR